MTEKTRKPTLDDVASAAGVSEMTVSRVLRGKGVVSARTRRHVLKVVEQLGYVPNRVAGSLATSRSNQVAILIPSLHNVVFSQVTSGITLELGKARYNGIVGITDYNLDREEELVVSMMSWRPAAVIITDLAHSERTRNILGNAPVPVVEIMDTSSRPIDMCVGLNHADAGRVLAEHLVTRGYRRFGYLGWHTNDFAASRRFRSIARYLDDSGLPIDAPDIYTEPPDIASGKDGLRMLLNGRPDLDAVIFSNDTAAVGGIYHCMESGIDVPGRLAIAGFSGLQLGQELPRKLTTIRTRRFEIGRSAAQMVLDAMTRRRTDSVLDLGFELIEGNTS